MEFKMNLTPEIEKFFDVADKAIALNYELQLKNFHQRKYLAPKHWMSEYGTVDINVGRQSGKSLYINSRVTGCDLVICMNEEHKRHVFKDCPNVNTASELADVIVRTGAYRGYKRNDVYWNKIYIDEPCSVFSRANSQEAFYDLVSNYCNQVIMIGTPTRFKFRT